MQEQKYKTQLESQLEEITKELQAIGIHDPKNPSDWVAIPEAFDANEPDLNDAADTVEAWNGRVGLVATLEPRYNNIVLALKKIEEGKYGDCEVCGIKIEEKRLDVNPAARTCMAHMEEKV